MASTVSLSALLSTSEWPRRLSADRVRPWQLSSAGDGVWADLLPPPVHCRGLVCSMPGTGAHPDLATVPIWASTGQEGKCSLSGLCVCCWLHGWSNLGGLSGMPCAMGCACWAGYPGVSLLDPAPCLWLPHFGPNTSQELGQGLLWSQLCHSHQDRLQPPSCCLLCHKHYALFSILTMHPFDREKPPSHFSWAVLPCRFRGRWSV